VLGLTKANLTDEFDGKRICKRLQPIFGKTARKLDLDNKSKNHHVRATKTLKILW